MNGPDRILSRAALIVAVTLLALLATGGGASAATVGHNTVYGSTGNALDKQVATKVTMTEGGTITSITAYVGNHVTKLVRYGLYADTAGEPGALLAETAAVATNNAMQWQTIALPSTNVTAGDYWLALSFEHNNQQYRYTSTGGAFRETNNAAVSGNFQANWSGTTVSNASRISIYATYSPALKLADHDAGQETDAFTVSGSETNAELFAFNLDSSSATVTQLVFRISEIAGLVNGDWSGVEIIVDTNGDGDIGGGESTAVGGAGTVNQAAGTITFSTSINVTAATNCILRADFSSLSAGDTVTIGLAPGDITISPFASGSTTSIVHSEANYVADVLLVVVNSASLAAQETKRKTLFEGWGYRVVPISATATQAQLDAAAALADVAYVCETITSTDLGTKLKSTTIGVVNDEMALTDEFGISSTSGSYSEDEIDVTDATHYVSRKYTTGVLAITSSAEALHTATGTMASGAEVLAEQPASSDAALVVMELGSTLQGGGNATGRRVHLPWGASGFDLDSLSTDGTTLLQRAMKWAYGPIAHWKFDDGTGTTALDARGAHDGALTGAAWDLGYLRGGLDFNGAGEYVTVSDANSLDITDALTITAWIKGDTWGSGGDADVIVRKGGADPNNYQLAVIDSKLNVSLDATDTTGLTADTTLSTGTWYHVAVTWDGSWVRLFVNGVQDHTGAQAKSGPVGSDARDLYIGGRPGADYFDGMIDDVRLYNRALTPKEIAFTMTADPVNVVSWQEVDPNN